MGGVFANGLEISGKAVSAKTIAAMPDVCMTPPENPATPPGVPVPYPNFALAGDTEKGTSTVKIKDKIVNLKNKSDMSKTSGDEAGCAAKKGVVTSKNTGKSYFNSWSNDVKFEGEPVVRMSDLTTNNHASPVGNVPPWLHVAELNVAGGDCSEIAGEIHEYRDAKKCPEGSQSHHIVDNCSFTMTGARSVALKNIENPLGVTGRAKRNLFQPDGPPNHPGVNYDEKEAPCICLEGSKSDPTAEHGIAHETTEDIAARTAGADRKWKYSESRDAGVESIKEAKGLEDWEGECIKLILDQYYKDKMGCEEGTEIVSPPGQSSATEFADGKGNNITAYELV